MMAEVLGLKPSSLRRWQARSLRPDTPRPPRPGVLGPDVRSQLREQYIESLHQWGPSVLACWAEREGLGTYSPTTIARAIEDLRPEKPPRRAPRRWSVHAPGVMWSEDGTGFRVRGTKHELVLVQDEFSRLKVGSELVRGPASGDDVRRVLQRAFEAYGAPLVLKRDGGSIFDEASVMELLEEHGVTVITSPPGYPRYNGRMERAMRDVKSHERAQRRHAGPSSLAQRIDRALDDLNNLRPRPVLGGRTAAEAHQQGRQSLPDRNIFRSQVAAREREILRHAADRHDVDAARRRAVEDVLSWHSLMAYTGDVSTDYPARRVTG